MRLSIDMARKSDRREGAKGLGNSATIPFAAPYPQSIPAIR